MTSAPGDDEIEKYLNANSPQYYNQGHEVHPASQPITSFALHPSFKLVDFGHGNYAGPRSFALLLTLLRSPSSVVPQ